MAAQVIANRGAIEEALRRAAAAARREYVRAGLSMPVWRGGRLVWVEPTELELCDVGDDRTGGRSAVAEDPRYR